MGGSPDPAVTPPPEKINIQTPTGSTTFGTFDEAGNFIPDPGLVTQLTEESISQQQLRELQEGLGIDLAGQLGGELVAPRSADEIRGRVPFATQLADDLSGFQQADIAQLGGVDFGAGASQFGGALPELGGDFGGLAASAEQATFQRAQNLLAPQFQQQREDLSQSLANRGIPINSEAAQKELNRLDASQGTQFENLALSSVAGGRAEQERLSQLELAQRGQLFGEQATQAGVGLQQAGLESQFALGVGGQELAAQQLAAAQRGQELGERDLEFQRSLEKQLALSNLEAQQRAQQVAEVQGTGLLGTPFQPTPITAISAGSTGATPANPLISALGTIGGAAAGGFFGGPAGAVAGGTAGGQLAGSDKNLKENIELVGNTDGLDIYEFDYKDKKFGTDRYRGVMAQDVLSHTPTAVIIGEDGFFRVDYSQLPVNMETV